MSVANGDSFVEKFLCFKTYFIKIDAQIQILVTANKFLNNKLNRNINVQNNKTMKKIG